MHVGVELNRLNGSVHYKTEGVVIHPNFALEDDVFINNLALIKIGSVLYKQEESVPSSKASTIDSRLVELQNRNSKYSKGRRKERGI